jgi:hypothetical protein
VAVIGLVNNVWRFERTCCVCTLPLIDNVREFTRKMAFAHSGHPTGSTRLRSALMSDAILPPVPQTQRKAEDRSNPGRRSNSTSSTHDRPCSKI